MPMERRFFLKIITFSIPVLPKILAMHAAAAVSLSVVATKGIKKKIYIYYCNIIRKLDFHGGGLYLSHTR